MNNCKNCNSTNLMTSAGESKLIPGAKYVACRDCGNVMMLVDETLIPTPTTETEMTKTMIEDATQCFDGNEARLLGVSLTAEDNIRRYVDGMLEEIQDDEEEFDMDMEEYDYDEECVEDTSAEGNDYLLVSPSGEKQIYKNCSKEFMLNIINSLNGEVKLYEINEIELKQEIRYSF